MAGDPGAHFSLARILEPLPVDCTAAFCDVLAHVDATLALPVLKCVLSEQGCGQVDDNVLANVLWKLQTFLPSLVITRCQPGKLAARLKEMQDVAPDATLVRIPARQGMCPHCEGISLCPCPGIDRYTRGRNLPVLKADAARRGTPPESNVTVRYKIYSWTAGVQYAVFEESRCPKCSRFFLGGWS